METLAALAAQVQNLATRLHELEQRLDRVSVESKEHRVLKGTTEERARLVAQQFDSDYRPLVADKIPNRWVTENRAELDRLRARISEVEAFLVL